MINSNNQIDSFNENINIEKMKFKSVEYGIPVQELSNYISFSRLHANLLIHWTTLIVILVRTAFIRHITLVQIALLNAMKQLQRNGKRSHMILRKMV